jgi:diacylglycerol kinase family enzyme
MPSIDRVSPRSAARWRPLKRPLLLVVNPSATGVSPAVTERLAAKLGEGFEVDVQLTARAGQATELAAGAAGEGHGLVAALGGDGTVSEVAAGLAGTATALACLPAGRTNVFSRTLGHGKSPEEAADLLLAARDRTHRRRVDLGTVNGRYFTFASGVGFSATLNRRVAERAGFGGPLNVPFLMYEVLSTLGTAYLRDPPRLRVELGTRTVEGVTAVLQNSSPLTYLGSRPIEVCEGAALESGTLSLTMLRRSRVSALPGIVARVLAGPARRIQRHPWVVGASGLQEVIIRPADERPLPVEVDGDYLGELDEVRYGVAPGKLLVAG